MTSNLGSQMIQEQLGGEIISNDELEKIYSELRIALSEMLRQSIRPEFLNRIDEIILFKLLNKEDLKKIAGLQLKRVQSMLKQKNIEIDFTDEAKEWLIKLGYDPTLGARPLKRVIQKYVVNKLSEEILSGSINEGDIIELSLDKRGLIQIVKKTTVGVIK
jgi:ATP-dependent Clp protease ATP-binding subunit ClpB